MRSSKNIFSQIKPFPGGSSDHAEYKRRISVCLTWPCSNCTAEHRGEPSVLKPLSSEDEIATEMLKMYKSPDTDRIMEVLKQAGNKIIISEINEHLKSIY
jgi:hypothetical protein